MDREIAIGEVGVVGELFVSIAVIEFFNDTTNERADSGRAQRNLADHPGSECQT